MGIKNRLIFMNFLQFFVWGSWLISIGAYLGGTLHFTGTQIGAVFSTLGIASLFMPALLGIVADKWVNAERVLGMSHLIGAGLLFLAATIKDPVIFFWVMLLNSMFYMPTIALNSTVSYVTLEKNGYNIVKAFPPIRVWGTVGFIAAMWIVDLFGWKSSNMQLIFSGFSALALGFYAFTMPSCPPEKSKQDKSLISSLGLDAFVLFKQRKMAVFFFFSMFLGAALQITNAFGGSFLDSFKTTHPDTFGVQHPLLLLSISQISETLFILTIPFFLNRFGIKKVMIISIFAWVMRFGLFAIGDPGGGLYLLIMSMIVYGMAFDFFNISGSLFVENEVSPGIRASAQGLFMLMTNGVGAMIGGYGSGLIVDLFTADGIRDWNTIWLVFAGYALVLGLIFPIVFKYKHNLKNETIS
ncbi:MAG: nucleoside permease [Bacteroidota bacterium]|nr:MFS transporter [Odoribacter sp.]MDP3642197.1 nucleoside permease [Bacteroidota bacterium]